MFFGKLHPCRCRATAEGLAPLHRLQAGQTGVIRRVDACGAERSRLLAMGFVSGRAVQVMQNAQGPMTVLLGASRVCLCRHQARHILVELQEATTQNGEDKPPRGCLV